MKFLFLRFEFLLVVAINFYFEYSRCNKIIYINISKCENGYTGINCKIPTCIGYELCNNGSICAIKNNTHSCICQLFDNKGVYKEIKNCKRKFTIPNGICFSIKTRDYCECKTGWTGSNCEIKLANNSSSSGNGNVYKKRLNKYQKLKYNCTFIDKYNNNASEKCYNQYSINNGVCYLIRDRFFPTCSCSKGWEGGDYDCETATCNKYEGCLNGGFCYIENNRHSCICENGYYGDNCEEKCDISCGTGRIIINSKAKACECLCAYPYILPNCDLPTVNTTTTLNQTVIISTEFTSSKTTLILTTQNQTKQIAEFTTSTEKPSDSITNNITIISYASSTSKYASTITPTITTPSEPKFSPISTTTKSNFTEYSETITKINNPLISTTSTTTSNTLNNNSFSKIKIKLEFISIPIAIAFSLLAILLIYYYRKSLNRHLHLKMNRFDNSNTEL